MEPVIKYLQIFLEDLIVNYKEKDFSSKDLLALAKALYMTENFRKLKFDGEIRIESGFKFPKGISNCYVLTVNSDEIILSNEGHADNEMGGSDSFGYEILNFDIVDDYFSMLMKFGEWKDGFNDLSNNGKRITTIDDVGLIEESDFYYDEEIDEESDEDYEEESDDDNYSEDDIDGKAGDEEGKE